MKIHVVLYEPEIPQNTGNIARTCVAFNIVLHLIRPYGFILSDKKLKRAGVDYWKYLKLHQHDCWNDFIKILTRNDCLYFFTRYGKKNLANIKNIKNKYKNIYLIFGKESTGLPKEILLNNINNCLRIPICKNVRALNVSNCVAIGCYHFMQLLNFPKLEKLDLYKIDYLGNNV